AYLNLVRGNDGSVDQSWRSSQWQHIQPGGAALDAASHITGNHKNGRVIQSQWSIRDAEVKIGRSWDRLAVHIPLKESRACGRDLEASCGQFKDSLVFGLFGNDDGSLGQRGYRRVHLDIQSAGAF